MSACACPQFPGPSEKSQNFLWEDFRKLANKLIHRELTGHAARDAILTAMESATKEEWNGFYRRVLIKDLRCGVSEKTINKIAYITTNMKTLISSLI